MSGCQGRSAWPGFVNEPLGNNLDGNEPFGRVWPNPAPVRLSHSTQHPPGIGQTQAGGLMFLINDVASRIIPCPLSKLASFGSPLARSPVMTS